MFELQDVVGHVSFSYLLGRILTIFFKRDFSFEAHSTKILYDGMALAITLAVCKLVLLGDVGTLLMVVALLYSSFRTRNEEFTEIFKTLAISSSIFIVLYGNFDERLFDCLTLAFATTQFLRKPEGLKEMLRELRIICGPVYVILMCSGLRFHPILDFTWDLPSWTTRLAVLASVVAAVFFRPDNSQTLKLVFAGSRILDTNNRRRIHGYLMFTGFVLTFTKVLAASMALTPGVFVFAVFFGVLNCVLYLMYKRSRHWR